MLANRKVSVVICNYNRAALLRKCLLSLKKQTYKNIEIVLVDNGSVDKSIAIAIRIFPSIILIRNKKNNGFAEANNQGVTRATGDYILLLNNDTELFPSAIAKLLSKYEPKSILSARQIATSNRRIQRTGAGVDIFGYPYQETALKNTKIFYADGAALFMKKSDFFRLGQFDKSLFMFQEDVDLSWRAHLMGYKIIPCWESKLLHVFGGTAEVRTDKQMVYTTSLFRRYHNEKNVIRNIIKNYSAVSLFFLLPLLIFLHLFEMIFLICTGNQPVALCYLKAYGWNISNLRDTLSKRKFVQSKRIISDFQLFKKMYFRYAKLDVFIKLGIPNFYSS